MASGLSLTAAARQAKVGVPTAKHWSATLSVFRRRVQELRAEMTSQALGRLVDSMVRPFVWRFPLDRRIA